MIDLGNLRGENLSEHEVNIYSYINMPVSTYEKLSKEEKTVSNLILRNHCLDLKNGYKPKITWVQKRMANVGPALRHFDLSCYAALDGKSIPDDGCIIVLNHSNSHDGFIIAETLRKLNHESTFLAGSEGLSALETGLFKGAHSTMIDRLDKESCNYGLIDFAGKVANGDTGIVFGEGTWNLHPYKEMLPIKIGAIKVAAITGKPIIPTIMEYIENPGIITSEKDLYSECVVCFGNPIYVSLNDSYVETAKKVQIAMESLRRYIRAVKKVDKSKANFDPEEYVNHTWLKKFGTNVFEFDSIREIQFVRGINGAPPENEYFYNENGILVPGIVPKDYYVKQKKLFRGIRIVIINEEDKSKAA